MAVDPQILASLSGLSDLSADELSRIAAQAATLPVIEGEVLATKGAAARTFFIALSGAFMVTFEDGRALTLHTPGSLLGLSAVLPPWLHRGTTTALTSGEVVALPGETLRSLMQEELSLGDKLKGKIDSMMTKRSVILK